MMQMRRSVARWVACAVLWIAVDGVVPTARAQDAPPERTEEFREQVAAAIARGVAWFRKAQLADGMFPTYSGRLEQQALSYQALRASGVSVDDPNVALAYSALQQLYAKEKEFNGTDSHFGTAETARVCMAIAAHGTIVASADATGEAAVRLSAADLAWMKDLAKFLEGSQRATGRWPSYVDLEGPEEDLGYTYAAVMGLKAAARSGVPVKRATWQKSLRYFLDCQASRPLRKPPAATAEKATWTTPLGRGWDDLHPKSSPEFEPWGWPTANALASIAICRSEILADRKSKPTPDPKADLAVKDGLLFLGTFEGQSWEPGGEEALDGVDVEVAYDIERAGDLLGVERMGPWDWWGDLAARLIQRQGKDGSWCKRPGSSRSDAELFLAAEAEATAYALLVLARGTNRAVWTVTAPTDDRDVNFGAAAKLGDRDFEDFIDLVLSRWSASKDAAVKTRFWEKTTAVGGRIVPPLVRRLADDDADVRGAAIALLRHATGLDHGYDAAAPAEERAAAVGRWEEWAKARAATLTYDPATGRLKG